MSESSFSYIVVLVLIYLSLLFQNKHINIMCVFPCKSESEVAQSRLTLCVPMDYSWPSSSIHGIFHTRILEWVAISSSRKSSQPRDWTQISDIVGRCFTVRASLRQFSFYICICSKFHILSNSLNTVFQYHLSYELKHKNKQFWKIFECIPELYLLLAVVSSCIIQFLICLCSFLSGHFAPADPRELFFISLNLSILQSVESL